MHFKRVVNSVNRPHFLAERDGDVILLNFCQDHRTMKCRTLDQKPYQTSTPTFGFGKSVFGYDDDDDERPNQRRAPKAKRTSDFPLHGNSRHGLGATDGKVNFLDDSQRSEFMSIWRVDCDTVENEFTRIPSGYITRFSDSEYIVQSKYANAREATIYLWKTGENAEMIRSIKMPNNVGDRTRIAYGKQLMFIKAEDDKILITSLNVITEEVKNKTINMEIVNKTMRWFCAKNHLLAVASGRVNFIHVHSLAHDAAPTNLYPSGKYHPFAVDSSGFVYILCPTADGCTVQRARDESLAAEADVRIIIPKQEKVALPKKEKIFAPKKMPMTDEKGNFINVHFNVTYRGNTIFDKKMRMLCTKPLGDVIRRSPEIPQPPETRLKLFYMNEEILTFRTPNFLRMFDGDRIYAEFIDNQDYIETQQEDSRDTGVFSRAELAELTIDTPEVQLFPQKRVNPMHMNRSRRISGGTDSSMNAPSSSNQTNGPRYVDAITRQNMLSEYGFGNLEAKEKPKDSRRQEIPEEDQKKPKLLPIPPPVALLNEVDERSYPAPVAPLNVEAERTVPPQVPHLNEDAEPPIPPQVAPRNVEDEAARIAQLRQEEKEEARDRMREKLLSEMQWLREYIKGNRVFYDAEGEGHEMELLKKKYVRALLMMGRSETQK